jgi:flagellar assembly protein FliH
MSCKVLRPDDEPPVETVAWRHVRTPLQQAGAGQPAGPDGRQEIEHMRRQMEQHVRDAHGQGYREGEAAGRGQATAETRPVIERLSRTIEEISGLRGRLRREAEADTIQLALAIARRVLRRQLAIDPEALHGLVLGALERLEGQEISRVRVHPAHAALVGKCLEQYSGGVRVEITPDPSRELGAVVFETQRGNLDASIDSQLQEIERGLADCLRRQP